MIFHLYEVQEQVKLIDYDSRILVNLRGTDWEGAGPNLICQKYSVFRSGWWSPWCT